MITNEAAQATITIAQTLVNEIDLDKDIAIHQAFILVLKFNRGHHWTDEQIQQAYEDNSAGIQAIYDELERQEVILLQDAQDEELHHYQVDSPHR